MPKDVRTLLQTPRNRIILTSLEPGQYVHFNLEAAIVENLSNVSFVPTVEELELDFNTDGCYLDKSGNIHIWPIQCKIANIQNTKPIVVGIYTGAQKPRDPNTFLQNFISDITKIMSTGGITFNGNKLPLRLRCFIADAPARAFILNHRSHISSKPCSKCKVSQVQGRYVFNGVNHIIRTDEEYIKCLDEDHHKEGTSPLSLLPMSIVSQVPFEYMHLVCLDVMKKLLSAWVHGKYSRLSKLSGRDISVISGRLNILKKYCPSEFARRSRSLDSYSKFKATEFRQFLLYTNPIVTYGLLNKQLYTHFLFLHSAIRILISKSPSKQYLNFAELALQKFVLRSEDLYGPTFNSYNVHGLLHLTNDVRRLGVLDSFSAFPYENNMKFFRKYCRKPHLPLQQFFNRIIEKQIHGTNNNCDHSFIHTSIVQNKDTNYRQCRKIKFNNISFNTDVRDNCCILHDGSICIIFSIVPHNNSYTLGVKRFLEVHDFYDIGILSSNVQVYKCAMLSNDIFYISLHEVNTKCYRMPFWNCISTNDGNSDEEDDSEITQYIVITLHSENL